MRRRARSTPCLAATLALLAGGCIGWPKVETTTHNDDVLLRSFEREQASAPTVLADSSVVLADDGQPAALSVEARREQTCKRTLHRVVDRTEIEQRDFDTDTIRPLGYVLGGLGVTGFVSGNVLILSGKTGGDCFACALTAAGALLSYNMVAVIAAEFRAIDRRKHLGPVEESQVKSTGPCRAAPLAHAPVRVLADSGELLLEGTTDARGRFVAPVDLQRALELGTAYRVNVGGADVGRVSIQVSGAFRAP